MEDISRINNYQKLHRFWQHYINQSSVDPAQSTIHSVYAKIAVKFNQMSGEKFQMSNEAIKSFRVHCTQLMLIKNHD